MWHLGPNLINAYQSYPIPHTFPIYPCPLLLTPSNSKGFPFRKLKNQGSWLRGCPRVAKLVSHRAYLPMAPLADAKAHELSDSANSSVLSMCTQ